MRFNRGSAADFRQDKRTVISELGKSRKPRIATATGQVIGWIDLTGLLDLQAHWRPVDVLNGIAYDADARSAVYGRRIVA